MTGFNGVIASRSNPPTTSGSSTRGSSSHSTSPARTASIDIIPFPRRQAGDAEYVLVVLLLHLDLDVAVDDATGEVFVSQSNGRTVNIYAPPAGPSDANGSRAKPTASRTTGQRSIGETCASTAPRTSTSRSTTRTPTRKGEYICLSPPPRTTSRRSTTERAVDFPATASYIENNKIIGTPSGNFGQVGNVRSMTTATSTSPR